MMGNGFSEIDFSFGVKNQIRAGKTLHWCGDLVIKKGRNGTFNGPSHQYCYELIPRFAQRQAHGNGLGQVAASFALYQKENFFQRIWIPFNGPQSTAKIIIPLLSNSYQFVVSRELNS